MLCYMLYISDRSSVRPSVTRVDLSKTLKLWLCNLHHCRISFIKKF